MEWPAQYDIVIDRGVHSSEKDMDEASEDGEGEDRMEKSVGEND